MLLCYIFFFIVGACHASFFITMGQRWAGQPCHGCRSQCPSCHHPLRWWQLLPLVGWSLQVGRCHDCHHPISPFSSVSELLCGLCFAASIQWPLTDWLAVFIVTAALLVMSATDWQSRWICPLCLPGLFPLFILFGHLRIDEVLFAVLPLVLLLTLTTQLGFLGGGDCEFLTVLLVTVGVANSAIIVLIASVSLLIHVLVAGEQQQRLPFIPCLSLGTGCLLINQLLNY